MKPALLLLAAAGIGALGGLYWLLQPPVPPAETVPAPARAEAEPAPQPRNYAYVVANGQRISGPAVIRLTQGDVISVSLRSDRDDELHLHGYDLKIAVRAGEPAQLAFSAEHSGRFELELHRGHSQIGVLEVQPK